jgi:CDP-diacylglycerol---serine O-phosphatidyltransferase
MSGDHQHRRPGLLRPLRPLRPRLDVRARRFRRGVYLLPSMFTMANLFCGYACVIYAMRGEYDTAAPFIGIAIVLDMLDGRIARLTGTASEFGVQFDSMADVISFGMAPAALTFAWGLSSLGRLGWAAAFLFVTGAALRLARFNIQTASVDKRFFVGLPSPAAAGVLAATVYAYPNGLTNPRWSIPAIALVVVPALLMVSSIRYRSFKTFDLGTRRSYRNLILIATVMAAIATHPQVTLAVMAYMYLLSGLAGAAWGRLYRRGDGATAAPAALPEASPDASRQEPPQGAAHSG